MPQSPKSHLTQTLETRFRRLLLSLVRPDGGHGVIVAFSGGPDSSALLHLFLSLKDELNLRIQAAHLDHGLRGKESDRDRQAAERAARDAGAAFHWSRVDCLALAKEKGMSIEEAGREARYEYFESIRQHTGADYIATGHTSDDNAELVMMNLLRGTGPQGLGGIPPARGHIIRPLLYFRRSELIEYLSEQRLSWVEDSSNLNRDMTRNRIRHDLIPRLSRDYNPAVKVALTRLARVMRDEQSVWDQLLDEARNKIGFMEKSGQVCMNISGLAGLPTALARRLIRSSFHSLTGDTKALSFDHVDFILNLTCLSGYKELDLPSGLKAWIENGQLSLGRPSPRPLQPFEYPLPVPGTVHLSALGLILRAEVHSRPQQIDIKGQHPWQAVLDFDRVSPPLTVRNARPGDRFQPLGMQGTKKLADFFIDAKIPARRRDKIPLIVDRQGIIWVGGLRPAERAKVAQETRKKLNLTIEEVL